MSVGARLAKRFCKSLKPEKQETTTNEHEMTRMAERKVTVATWIAALFVFLRVDSWLIGLVIAHVSETLNGRTRADKALRNGAR